MNARANRAASRGFSLIEAVVALAIAALVVGIPLTVMSAQGHGFARDETRSTHASQIDLFLAQLEMSAHSAVAIYTPTGCGTKGTGDGAACSSLRFYGVDSSGNPHFWGWEYNANASSVTQCLSYGSNSEGTCIETGGTIPVSRFTATPTLISTIAPHYGSTAVDVEKQVLSGDTRVIAGNRVMVVDVADAWETRTKHLLQDAAPFSAAILKGAFTPPTVGTLGFSGSSGPFWFWGTGDTTPQTVTVSEQNYGQYTPFLSPAWTVSGPNPACVSVAQNPLAGDKETFSIRARAVGACTFVANSSDQSSGSVQSYVAGPLTPMVNGRAQSGVPVVTLSWVGPGWSTVTIGAGKTYDNNENNNLMSIAATACTNVTMSANGLTAPGSDSVSYGARSWGVTGTASGTCTVTFNDSYTNETPVQVRIVVAATPSPTPPPTPTPAPTPTPTATPSATPGSGLTITPIGGGSYLVLCVNSSVDCVDGCPWMGGSGNTCPGYPESGTQIYNASETFSYYSLTVDHAQNIALTFSVDGGFKAFGPNAGHDSDIEDYPRPPLGWINKGIPCDLGQSQASQNCSGRNLGMSDPYMTLWFTTDVAGLKDRYSAAQADGWGYYLEPYPYDNAGHTSLWPTRTVSGNTSIAWNSVGSGTGAPNIPSGVIIDDGVTTDGDFTMGCFWGGAFDANDAPLYDISKTFTCENHNNAILTSGTHTMVFYLTIKQAGTYGFALTGDIEGIQGIGSLLCTRGSAPNECAPSGFGATYTENNMEFGLLSPPTLTAARGDVSSLPSVPTPVPTATPKCGKGGCTSATPVPYPYKF